MATSRIYHVRMYDQDHLVDATSKAAAAHHVLRTNGTVALATQRDIAFLVSNGVRVEEVSGISEAE